MKIIFFGTPQIASYCLEEIIKSKHQVLAVVTAQDKPAGRGQKIQYSDVKKTAINSNLPILQPQKLKNPEFLNELNSYQADLFIVVAFRMLPTEVWQMPPKGTINLHASYLPQYRGAAPINWAIINGETTTGVSTFFINDKIDTGNIILQQKIEITNNDNAGTLHDKIMISGAKLLIETIDNIEKNCYLAISQSQFFIEEKIIKLAPKIQKDDCKINWDRTSKEIYNFVRGLTPHPGAWSVLITKEKKMLVKIVSGKNIEEKTNLEPGTIEISKNKLEVVTKNGKYEVYELIPEGKRLMSTKDFLAGNILENCFFEKN